MTYNVFGGTLNLAQPLTLSTSQKDRPRFVSSGTFSINSIIMLAL